MTMIDDRDDPDPGHRRRREGAPDPVPRPAGPVRDASATRCSRRCARSPRARPTSSVRRWPTSKRPSPTTSASRHCVGVNSGTSALHLALICAGVGPGDEVITVPMTFIATTWAISYVGATPVFVDVDPVTYTMDAAPGRAADHPPDPGDPAGPPLRPAGRPGAAAGDRPPPRHPGHRGRRAGPRRPLRRPGRRDARACAAASASTPARTSAPTARPARSSPTTTDIAARLRALRDHAQSRRYHHAELGFNYRMDAFQGAVLGVKLKYLERVDRGPPPPGRALSRAARRPATQAPRRGRGPPTRLAPVRRAASRSATGSAASSRPAASRPACTTRSRSTSRMPTPTSDHERATSRSPSESRATASRCRSSRK